MAVLRQLQINSSSINRDDKGHSPLHASYNSSGSSQIMTPAAAAIGSRKSPRNSPRNSSRNSTKCTTLKSLPLLVAASTIVFVLVCLLQVSLHLDNKGNNTTLERHSSEWRVPTARRKNDAHGHSFDSNFFQANLDLYRKKTHRVSVDNPNLPATTTSRSSTANLRIGGSSTSRLLTGTAKKSEEDIKDPSNTLQIPFWDQPLLFKKRNSWQLMVVVLADDCLPHYDTGKSTIGFPSLQTIQDVLPTQHADIVVYLPQVPQSTLFSSDTLTARREQIACQRKLVDAVQTQFTEAIGSGQLQLVEGVVNPLPPRIQYDYNHGYPLSYDKLVEMKLPPEKMEQAEQKLKDKLRQRQLQIELDYSLGLDFAYAAELAYQYADLFFFVRSGTRLLEEYHVIDEDYAWKMIEQYEQFQERLDRDLLVHRFCYQSFLKNDMRYELPPANATEAEALPPQYQPSLQLPTGILMERHGLYRMSLTLRSLLPYHKVTTAGLLETYCKELLWEAQILYPMSPSTPNMTVDELSTYPPAMFEVPKNGGTVKRDAQEAAVEMDQPTEQVRRQAQQLQQESNQLSIPPWVTMDNSQLGPQIQRTPDSSNLLRMVSATQQKLAQEPQRLVTFVVPSSTRPNGIKNQYVTHSLNQLIPLMKRDFYDPKTKQFSALILLVICGNTQEDLDDHEKGLWEYYKPEIEQGIIEIVSTNLATYPSLYNLPNNYNDPENRLRWRSKQNLDISSSFFAAKGRSKYVMLLEDDTGYRDKFTTTLKMMLHTDMRREAGQKTDATYQDDYTPHMFSQIHFGFGYSGVLIHDDDALVYAVLHYILMDEKPCDLMYLANHLQGDVLDQKWRWQLKRVLITHLGSVSSLKGKIQPVWGLKG